MKRHNSPLVLAKTLRFLSPYQCDILEKFSPTIHEVHSFAEAVSIDILTFLGRQVMTEMNQVIVTPVTVTSLEQQQQHDDDDDDDGCRVPLLQRLGANDGDDESSSGTEESDQGSEESHRELQRREAMDAIEEAWEGNQTSLCLRSIHLDRFSVALLLEKWQERNVQRRQPTHNSRRRRCTKTIRTVILDRCTFTGGYALRLFVIFLNQIGDELKELSFTDGCIMDMATPPGQSPLGALLGGMGILRCLESLIIERADLRGQLTGFFLRCILANNPNLKILQLQGCGIDDAMYDQLLDGLKHHFELRYLDVGGWNMDDQHLGRLVDALVYGGGHKHLELLDISGSSIGTHSLKSLASLLYQRFRMEELVLCSCSCSCADLFDPQQEKEQEQQQKQQEQQQQTVYYYSNDDGDQDLAPSPAQEADSGFVKAIENVLSMKNNTLRLSYCHLPSPLYQMRESDSTVEIVPQKNVDSATVSSVPNASSSPSDFVSTTSRTTTLRKRGNLQMVLTSSSSHTADEDFYRMDSYLDNCLSMMLCV